MAKAPSRQESEGNFNRIVVIGASTGGRIPLQTLISQLPANFAAPVLIVSHCGPYRTRLAEILNSISPLEVREAADKDFLRAGTVLVAPPDHHLLVEDDRVRLGRGPKENFARPAIDPLFRSAALNFRERAIGIILSGNLDDGTVGLQAIQTCGGTVIVQDPREAEVSSMPISAIDYCSPDLILPANAMAHQLVKLVSDEAVRSQNMHPEHVEDLPAENSLALDPEGYMDLTKVAQPSTFTCPECSGTIWEFNDSRPVRFRCHTGHAFTMQALGASQARATEEAVWSAVRALHEQEMLHNRRAKLSRKSGNVQAATESELSAQQARANAEVLKQIVELRSFNTVDSYNQNDLDKIKNQKDERTL